MTTKRASRSKTAKAPSQGCGPTTPPGLAEPLTEELIAIARVFGVVERDAVCCGTVTVPQCIVLQTLLKGPSPVSGLAAASSVSLSAMTHLVDGIVKKGWVMRTPDQEDRRRVQVALTADGQREAERLQNLTVQTVAFVLDQIPSGKHEQVLESLQPRLLRREHGAPSARAVLEIAQ